MLRLAHRISSERNYSLNGSQDEIRIADFERSLISGHAEVIISDNVARFYDDSIKDEYEPKDFPNCAPPFDVTFIECDAPRAFSRNNVSQAGWLCVVLDREEFSSTLPERVMFRDSTPPETKESIIERTKWPLLISMWLSINGRPHWPDIRQIIAISDDGLPLHFLDYSNQNSTTAGVSKTSCMHIPLLTLSFLNCRNVKRIDATNTEGPEEKWIRRKKSPRLRYHILDINPMKEVLRTEGQSESTGLKKALHICRGHFATYTENKPLFGHFTGTVWKPAHVRGEASQGAVLKDYSVSPR